MLAGDTGRSQLGRTRTALPVSQNVGVPFNAALAERIRQRLVGLDTRVLHDWIDTAVAHAEQRTQTS